MGEVNLRKAESAAEEGDLERARDHYLKAINCYGGEALHGARAKVGLAAVYAELEQADDARQSLETALPVLEAEGDARTHARALNQLGLLVRRGDEPDRAEQLHTEARAVAASAGDLRQQAVALRNLAAVDRARGSLARAIARLKESIELQKAEGDPRGTALIWRQVRGLELEAGALERAYEAARAELDIREGLGEGAAVAATLYEAAGVARLLGRHAEAEGWLSRAAELRAHTGDLEGTAKALLRVAAILLEVGRPRAARRKLEAARDALGEQGPVDLRAELWRAFAETDLAILDAFVYEDDPRLAIEREAGLDTDVRTDDATGEPQLVRRAREQADEALELARQSSAPELLAPALCAVGRACAHQGNRDLAREHFRASVKAAEERRGSLYELGGACATYLAYGTWLGRQTRAGADAASDADRQAAVDYLERAAILAAEAMASGIPADPAACARGAMAAFFARVGEPEAALAQVERARELLGPAVEEPESPRARLRAGLDELAARAAAGDGVSSDIVLRTADEAARSQLARLSPEELRDTLFDLRRLQEITKALNSELDLDRLLDLIIDGAIELMGAERGFLILTGAARDDVAFKVARNLERTEVERPDRKVSNTIARRAIENGSPIVTGDASNDERFSGALSVAEQRLRSVVSVPLRVKGEVTGALYLDHRFKEGLFGPRAVEMLESLSDHAAVALENARLVKRDRAQAAALTAERERLKSQVESQTVELEEVRERLAAKSREEGSPYQYDQIVGRSPPMERVFRLLDKVVDSTIPVFIHGESGTGKELIARAIHYNGPRRDGPFVSENFAAIVEELLESELFGHLKGSFTGAISDKKGLFERANGGTIFLDEVGDLSEQMQKELLRVLEEREVRPIGATDPIPVDVRIVSATHRDLKQMVAEGTFRQDLFYRLHVFAIALPPLRERREDIPLLAERFLDDHAREVKAKPRELDPEAMRKLMAYPWPGNIRELKNFVDRTVLLARGRVIQADDVQLETDASSADVYDDLSHVHWSEAKEAFARRYLTAVLARVGGNISLAARESGMLRQAFQRLLKRHEIDANEFREKPVQRPS